MKLSEYLSVERGRGANIASVLNVAPQQVYQWASGSRSIPVERCVEIEHATEGAVTRRDLRPDDWQRIWPELAATNAVKHGRRKGDKRTS
ncbi:MAG TPA: Cro/CI family transcriptional regulator [Noviherbaspirillum sp.]|jgi:DNA-binding transcriptional regulator YdaS (Cro superfamily)|uniref:transcriptional regulator n=1 Tax=Noviherbaspirillum sp. TaxID=1926288 RepID=UPI002DDCC634|nr:Cro/CI family transcriptional regulator [Noviherbaspirillum sp.]HEV2612515.1 Cro/CI family transcriptional regulator [Noviherbaspirillum sp.]